MKKYWNVLEIKETHDKEEIRKAYLKKLPEVNPEEDPEGFKELREAYEKLSKMNFDEKKENSEKLSETDKWIKEAEKIYDSFSRRMDENEWKEILEEDICFALDTREEISLKLLEMLADRCYIPYNIWRLLNKYFKWEDEFSNLKEKFSATYLDYIKRKLHEKDIIDFTLFGFVDDDLEYDKWISLFFKIRASLFAKETEEAEKLYQKILKLGIEHPYLDCLRARYYIIKEEQEKAKEIVNNLMKLYSDNAYINFCCAEALWSNKEYEEAYELYENAYEYEQENKRYKAAFGDCCIKKGNGEKAKEIFKDLINTDFYNSYYRLRLKNANDILMISYQEDIEKAEKESDKHKADEIRLKLCSCYAENMEFEKVIEEAGHVEITNENEVEVYDLLGRTYGCLKNCEKSIEYFNKVLEAIDRRKERNEQKGIYKDESKNEKIIYYQIGIQKTQIENYKEALEYFEKSLKIDENFGEALVQKSSVLIKMKQFDKALKVLEKSLEAASNIYTVHYNMAVVLKEQKNFSEALKESFEAEKLYKYDAENYKLQMEIYLICRYPEKALEVFEKADQLNIINFELKNLKINALRETGQIKEAEEESLKILKEIEENDGEDNDFTDFFFNRGIILIQKNEYKNAADCFTKAIEYAVKHGKTSEEMGRLYYFRGFCYKCLGDYTDAFNDFDKNINLNPDKEDGYRILGILYTEVHRYDDAFKQFLKAFRLSPEKNALYVAVNTAKASDYLLSTLLKKYNKLAEENKMTGDYLAASIVLKRLGKFEEALKELENIPEDQKKWTTFCFEKAEIYFQMEDYEKALEEYKKAAENIDNDEFKELFIKMYQCFEKVNDYEGLIKYTELGMQYFKDDKEILNYHAKANFMCGNIEKVYKIYKNYADENALKEREGYREIAKLYIKYKKDYKEAFNIYIKAAEQSGGDETLFKEIKSVSREVFKNSEKQADDKERKIRVIKESYLYLADKFEKLKLFDETLECYKKAFSITEKNEIPVISDYEDIIKLYNEIITLSKMPEYENMMSDFLKKSCVLLAEKTKNLLNEILEEEIIKETAATICESSSDNIINLNAGREKIKKEKNLTRKEKDGILIEFKKDKNENDLNKDILENEEETENIRKNYEYENENNCQEEISEIEENTDDLNKKPEAELEKEDIKNNYINKNNIKNKTDSLIKDIIEIDGQEKKKEKSSYKKSFISKILSVFKR